jgi:DNA-binding NarL/FixJ family response regulator
MNEPPTLTERETQVRRLILEGMHHKEIAAELELTENAVKIHAHTLYQKYGVRGRVQLVAKIFGVLP